jgi:hypothetical protein
LKYAGNYFGAGAGVKLGWQFFFFGAIYAFVLNNAESNSDSVSHRGRSLDRVHPWGESRLRMQGGIMNRLALSIVLTCLLMVRMANAASVLKPIALPAAEGSVVGAVFSPDSSRLAVMRNIAAPGGHSPRHVMQIVELRSGQEVAHADVLSGEPVDLATNAHMIAYSSDGRYLLLATKGSDTLSIIDGTTLEPLNRIALHPEAESRPSLGQGYRYFRGVVSLATSAKSELFAVLTHDELQGNEAFIGSFSSGQIVKGWSLGKGRTARNLVRHLFPSATMVREQLSHPRPTKIAFRRALTICTCTTQAVEIWSNRFGRTA